MDLAKRKRVFEQITKAYLYNFDPLKPHFYKIVKHYFLLISAPKTYVLGLVRTRLVEAVLTSIHNLCFEQKYEN